MKTREQIEKRIASIEEKINWLNEDIIKEEKKFENGVHSYYEAERINRNIEQARNQIQEAYREMQVLSWVLND